jgi:steroid 5-alpha reductase family enzyme
MLHTFSPSIFDTASVIALFTLAWFWARACDNYSLVDAFWAGGLAVSGLFFLLATGPWNLKKEGIALLFALWSLRLTWHLTYRIAKAHPEEDRRYQELRTAWKKNEALFSFLFFQAQALSVVLLTLPFFLVGRNPHSSWSVVEVAGCLLLLIGISGEAVADHQLASFKKHRHNYQVVCQKGLWNYSRHPNYFFEILIWISFYLIACGSPGGWMTFYAPATIILLLLKVTGIPPAEAASLRSKGEAYRAYQKTTSVLIPWSPKKSSSLKSKVDGQQLN